MTACRYQGPLWGGTHVLLYSSSDQQRVKWVGSNVGNQAVKFILYMRHRRPKGSHADSHTAKVIATASTFVTVREIPLKRRKQKLLLPLRFCSGVFALQTTSSARFAQVPIFRAAVTPSITLLSFPSHCRCRLGSDFSPWLSRNKLESLGGGFSKKLRGKRMK